MVEKCCQEMGGWGLYTHQPSVPQFPQQRSGIMLIHMCQEMCESEGRWAGKGQAEEVPSANAWSFHKSVLLPQEKTLI